MKKQACVHKGVALVLLRKSVEVKKGLHTASTKK